MKYAGMLIGAMLGFAVIYLIGAFTANSFNLSDWTTDGRFFVGMMGLMAACAMAAITNFEYNLKHKNGR